MTLVARSALPLPLVRRGKVREVYAVGDDHLLLVASDRVSAFDVIMAEPVPRKGEVLTQLSAFWFDLLADRAAGPTHFVTARWSAIVDRVPALTPCAEEAAGRSMLVRRTIPVSFECVVRGYLAGSAWSEYRRDGSLAGEPLPAGLMESSRLDPPLFSPATKAESGHDENVTFGAMQQALGVERADQLRVRSLSLYEAGRAHALDRGLIVADTKFEFGAAPDGRLLLIDEVFTPDSSRFWPLKEYAPGRTQASFDKQPLRDYLAGLKGAGNWSGDAPPPALPDEVVAATSARYLEAYRRLTGVPLPEAL